MDLDAHIADLVRQGDPDRYISTLYAPESRRGALLALYAFAIEVGSVRDRVREPLAGEIRLQWWRDVIEAGSEAGQGSPVAEALMKAVAAHDLPRQPLLDLLEARIFDLYDDPMPSRNDLEGYCGETASVIFQLAALILDPPAARSVSDLAGHAGCAYAIAGIARTLTRLLARGQCFIPLDILEAVGTDAPALVERRDREAAIRAVSAFAALGSEHATAFREHARSLPASLRPAFLPVATAPAYLARIAARPAEVLDRPVDISPLRRHWHLFRHAARGWK
ncbi:MAG: phytoene/squalene synthase family protein [Mesorhizobium sp.]|nr:phytoene/squalene synthase family protein [Mesorhizobium sp.]